MSTTVTAQGKPQQEAFNADLDRLNKALEDGGHVMQFEDDGQTLRAISPDAPKALTDPYDRLIQYGYANGLI